MEDATDPSASSSIDWASLLANEDAVIYNEQAEINREISSRLQDASSSQSNVEILVTILREQTRTAAKADVGVLCTVATAFRLGIGKAVLANEDVAAIESCIRRAQSKCLSLMSHAAELLSKEWGDCSDICKHTHRFSPGHIEELSNLCKLGISKERAKEEVARQIQKRRGEKKKGSVKTLALQKIDIQSAINVLGGRPAAAKDTASAKPSRKRRGKSDTTYQPVSKKAKTTTTMDLGSAISGTQDKNGDLEVEVAHDHDRATNLRGEFNSSPSPASPIRFGSATPTDHLSINHSAHFAMSDAPPTTPNASRNTTVMTPVTGEPLSIQQIVDLTESLRASPVSILEETIETSKDPSPPSVNIPNCQIIDHMHEDYIQVVSLRLDDLIKDLDISKKALRESDVQEEECAKDHATYTRQFDQAAKVIIACIHNTKEMERI